MTFIKIVFVLLILAPVAILMWNLISRLIAVFTERAKENAEEEREKDKVSKETKRKKEIDHGRYGERDSGSRIGYMDKRKRRKERRKKKKREQ